LFVERLVSVDIGGGIGDLEEARPRVRVAQIRN
jgi:hypothetical protein